MPVKRMVVVLLSIVVLLAGCSKAAETPSQNFIWDIQIDKAEIQPQLNTIEVVTLYNGDKDEVEHENIPSAGNVYVLLQLTITKTGSEAASFEWKDLSVLDSKGIAYQRLENDSFIQQHNYSPRMTGLSIRFGENKGWVCFEIPESIAGEKLFLVHTTSEGQQKIEIKK